MSNPATPKLSDTQLIILSSASQRDDGLAILPKKLRGGAAKKVVQKLLALGLLREVRVKRDQPAWRTDEEERPIGLKITEGGADAIVMSQEAAGESDPAPEPKSRRSRKNPLRSDPPRTSLARGRSRRRSSGLCGARTGQRWTTSSKHRWRRSWTA